MQDTTHVEDDRGKWVRFRHPVLQSGLMFAGEAMCLIVYLFSGKGRSMSTLNRALRVSWFSFALPALCDGVASALLNLGLCYVSASVFQMFRGTVVIFAGLFTVTILQKRLKSHNWLGIVMITAGAALVGASSLIEQKKRREKSEYADSQALLGLIMIILAQALNALQFIAEEKFVKEIKTPVLVAVGIEGVTGLCLCLLCLPFAAYLPAPDGKPLDEIGKGIRAVASNTRLQWTSMAIVLCIAVFNFTGISVTKRLSGTARAAIDVTRTAIIWVVGIGMHWERFHALQAVGFGILIAGTSVYNDIMRSCLPAPPGSPIYSTLNADLIPEGSEGSWSATSDDEVDSTWESVEGFLHPPPSQDPVSPQGGAGSSSRPIRMTKHVVPSQTMARSITILPGAFSPHSLASPMPDDDLMEFLYPSVASDNVHN